MKSIVYKKGYKYQLYRDYMVTVGIRPNVDIVLGFLSLSTTGNLVLRYGYAWDGPSGPTFDSANFMRGSLVHDALYQLIREDFLPREMKEPADKELRRICIEDGMSKLRAWWVYRGVRMFGQQHVMPSGRRKLHFAP